MSYQKFFDLLDSTVASLDAYQDDGSIHERHVREASDLLKRCGFVTLQILNTSLLAYPQLVLNDEVIGGDPVVVEPENPGGASLEAVEEPSDSPTQ